VTGSVFDDLAAAIRSDRPAALASVVDGPGAGGKLLVTGDGVVRSTVDDADLERVLQRDTEAAMHSGLTSVRHYGPQGQANEDAVTTFVEAYAPAPRMVIFGAVDFTAALVRVAKVLGYRVTVCDAREVFATAARFPQADEVVVDWPHRHLEQIGPDLGARDAVCVLTHDPKFDVPAIEAALATDVGYLGAMGSRRTTAEREQRLRERGLGDEQLSRLMAPIGLDLGARTPEETAVSICAEIIGLRTGRRPASLREAAGPIHG
jgi:xanthine dehydrogenase accessory factor